MCDWKYEHLLDFFAVRKVPCGCGVSVCGLEQVIRLSFFPSSLRACHKHGVDQTMHKMPNTISVDFSAASLPYIIVTSKIPLGVVRPVLEWFGKSLPLPKHMA